MCDDVERLGTQAEDHQPMRQVAPVKANSNVCHAVPESPHGGERGFGGGRSTRSRLDDALVLSFTHRRTTIRAENERKSLSTRVRPGSFSAVSWFGLPCLSFPVLSLLPSDHVPNYMMSRESVPTYS